MCCVEDARTAGRVVRVADTSQERAKSSQVVGIERDVRGIQNGPASVGIVRVTVVVGGFSSTIRAAVRTRANAFVGREILQHFRADVLTSGLEG